MEMETHTVTLTSEQVKIVCDALDAAYNRLVKKAERVSPRPHKISDQLRDCQITLQKFATIGMEDPYEGSTIDFHITGDRTPL